MITVYLLSYNEKFLLPQIDKWWRERFHEVKFELQDNYSTDGTAELARELGWNVTQFDSGGKMSDLVQMGIKEECWKNATTEWVWVSDFDEVPHFTAEDLAKTYLNCIRCAGWEMIDVAYTIDEAQYGIQNDGYSKYTCFKPTEIEKMNYTAGAHQANPVAKKGFELKKNDVEEYKQQELYPKNNFMGREGIDFLLLHMKWFNPQHALNRAFLHGANQSKDNLDRKWSFHFALPLKDHLNYFMSHFSNRQKIR